MKNLFECFSTKLEADGVFAKAGSIIDATIVEVPRQRNSWEVNARIKAGEVPAEWGDHKRVHKHTDARWVKKNGVNFRIQRPHQDGLYGELHEWNLSTVYRTQKGQMPDRIGQPDLQYLPLRSTGSP